MNQHGLSLDTLPENVRDASIALASSLRDILGDGLVALWLYGAVTFSDRPARLGDVDTHAVIRQSPNSEKASEIDDAQRVIGEEHGIEWDSWYVLFDDARLSNTPRHAFRDITDRAWALHRAHWLKGQYVRLHGLDPSEVVVPPTWTELEQGLMNELSFIERFIKEGRNDVGHAAFGIWNGCRILYSLETHEVVVSKRQGAEWALQNLTREWREAIEAAGRVYDGSEGDRDEGKLRQDLSPFISFVKERVAP